MLEVVGLCCWREGVLLHRQDFSGGFQIAAKRIGMLESFRAGANTPQGRDGAVGSCCVW